MEALKNSEPVMRRSVTMPVRPSELTSRRSSGGPSPESQVETLYKHPSVRIISFNATSAPIGRYHINSSPDLGEKAGTLSWTSPLERLIAVGPLSIYRAQGSVAFLSCGKVMHPILPKSQCWCVDESSSKFVLQIRRPQYWRIEVPTASPDGQQTSERLKEVFSQILLFEKTSCPFKRSFTVELPEAPTTPIKRKPWRPVLTPKSQMEDTQLPVPSPRTEMENTNLPDPSPRIEMEYKQLPEPSPRPSTNDEGEEESRSTLLDGNTDRQGLDSDSDATDDTSATPRNIFHRSSLPPLYDEYMPNESRVGRMDRSVTAPPQLTIVTSSPSKDNRATTPLHRSSSKGSVSSNHSSSVESFHTVQSWHSPITPLPPSPPESNPASPTTYPYPHDNISLPKRPAHAREISQITITPESPRVWEISRGSSTDSVTQVGERRPTPPPRTPTRTNDFEENLDEEHFEIAPPPSQQQVRHRATTGSNSRRRTLSPLPAAANIFSPSRRRPRRLQTARHLPTAIIQKTCEILLSPPSHLLHLMLNIAAKIAAGEWRGVVFGFGEGGERIVGEWDYEDGEMMGDDWDEDDYGISLGTKQPPSSSNGVRERVGRSWEVD